MIFVFLFVCSFLFVDGIAENLWHVRRNQHRAKCIMSFLLLISFYAFRGLSVLNDTSHYFESQQELIEGGDLHSYSFLHYDIFNRFEPGFQFLQRFLSLYIWEHPYVIIIFSAFAISIGLVYIAQKHTERIGLAIFLLLQMGGGMGQYTAIRQAFAVIVFYVIVAQYIKGKRLYAFLLVPIAMLFHKYAFILFVPLILSYFRLSKKNLLLSGFVAYVGVAFLSYIIDILGFSESRYIGETFDHTPLAVIISIVTSMLIAILCVNFSRRFKIQPIHKLYTWIFFLSLIFDFYTLAMPIMTRFQLYFKPYFSLVYIYYADRVPVMTRKRTTFFLVSFLLLKLLIILIFRNEWSHMVPYSFFDFGATYHETKFGY